jgi:hypothetical protein
MNDLLSLIKSAYPNSFSLTLAPTPPHINGPDGVILEDSTVVLTCTSPDVLPIMWFERNQSISLVPPVFDIHGAAKSSRLTINDINLNHSGVYVCQVGNETASFVIEVEMIGKRL